MNTRPVTGRLRFPVFGAKAPWALAAAILSLAGCGQLILQSLDQVASRHAAPKVVADIEAPPGLRAVRVAAAGSRHLNP
jgi:hypothetical protein